jgi:hypothetical protein
MLGIVTAQWLGTQGLSTQWANEGPTTQQTHTQGRHTGADTHRRERRRPRRAPMKAALEELILW